ncbi:hypothetical protein TI04_02680 [Achromatium sp. WMS2]|nr:hypothetical protein TI04_02680 [Achromatium sp. WMS2]
MVDNITISRSALVVIPAHLYAEEHVLTERQVIKSIINGELDGYQADGKWYVRISQQQTGPVQDPAEAPFVQVTNPITVTEYAQQSATTVAAVLEDIAQGRVAGFHAHGMWYVGIANSGLQRANSHRKYAFFLYVSIFIFILALLAGAVLVWYQAASSVPQYSVLMVKIEMPVGVTAPDSALKADLFLLNKDLESIINDYTQGLAIPDVNLHTKTPGQAPRWISMLAGATAIRNILFDFTAAKSRINRWEFSQNFEKSKIIWSEYMVKATVTNRSGQAWIRQLTPGIYWLIGWTATETELGFWQQRVELVPGENRIILNPRNALYFDG